MRLDGKQPLPPWLRGLDEMEARLAHLEALVAKIVAASAPAPKAAPKVAQAPEKKAPAPTPLPEKAVKKKAARKK